ncbi:hypothetical protein NL676_030777 [Syzygium grande]|nr:hypothetical protein NL676_030777 [Syzygium grande]
MKSCFSEEELKKFGSEVPMKRAGQPIEVAPCCVFLACNHCSSYITGQVLHPNGGYTRYTSSLIYLMSTLLRPCLVPQFLCRWCNSEWLIRWELQRVV